MVGSSTSGNDFIEPDVLEELLALKLVCWRTRDDLDLTRMGGEVCKKLRQSTQRSLRTWRKSNQIIHH